MATTFFPSPLLRPWRPRLDLARPPLAPLNHPPVIPTVCPTCLISVGHSIASLDLWKKEGEEAHRNPKNHIREEEEGAGTGTRHVCHCPMDARSWVSCGHIGGRGRERRGEFARDEREWEEIKRVGVGGEELRRKACVCVQWWVVSIFSHLGHLVLPNRRLRFLKNRYQWVSSKNRY